MSWSQRPCSQVAGPVQAVVGSDRVPLPRHAATKGVLVAMVCTFFEAFNVPVFWPILVMYFVMLFCITMKRQIKVTASRACGGARGCSERLRGLGSGAGCGRSAGHGAPAGPRAATPGLPAPVRGAGGLGERGGGPGGCCDLCACPQHMIKYRYIPFTHGKRTYRGKEDSAKTLTS